MLSSFFLGFANCGYVLGSGRGKSKLLQLYWTVADLPLKYRSKTDSMQLGLVIQEKLLKKYGYLKVYERLLRDMLELEHGIQIDKPFPRKVKISFTLHLGDNLESHSLGGFKTSFSKGYICRVCHIKSDELDKKIHDCGEEGENKYWSVEEYDSIVRRLGKKMQLPPQEDITVENLGLHLFDEIPEPGTLQETEVEAEDDTYTEEEQGFTDDIDDTNFNIKDDCPFNLLQSFHATESLPQDVMHDFLEGIMAEDLLGVIKILISKSYFDEFSYNENLAKFKFKRSDSANKPEKISIASKKLKGKAFSISTHVRFFGLLLVNLEPAVELFNEKAYVMFLYLSRILEKVMTPCIRYFEIENLEEETIAYLNLRREVFQEFPTLLTNPKPKHHYSNHYSQSILKYGPCPATWTARYESKNRVAKLLATSAKNFKNISLTVCRRQQMRQASVYYQGMFQEEIILPIGAKHKFELISVSAANPLMSEIINFMDNNSLLCEEINICNQIYKLDDVIVMKAVCTDYLEVGLIERILYKGRLKCHFYHIANDNYIKPPAVWFVTSFFMSPWFSIILTIG